MLSNFLGDDKEHLYSRQVYCPLFFSASATVQSTCRLTFVLFFVLADEKQKTLAFHFKNACSISSEKADNTKS